MYMKEKCHYICACSSILELAVDFMNWIVTHTDVRKLERFCNGMVVDG
jgi:hypothetical protein